MFKLAMKNLSICKYMLKHAINTNVTCNKYMLQSMPFTTPNSRNSLRYYEKPLTYPALSLGAYPSSRERALGDLTDNILVPQPQRTRIAGAYSAPRHLLTNLQNDVPGD
jgi:hypothetical protein